ncbi:hypothetical protein PMZ80_000991 [Knufia obscura]|uniref:Uncharacterized protein n=1 Tax=Knufia obscura TaxID=1635080 RepID=A0ABR0S1V4_9EURO|nr:hypothetical protein PMZ80_000991 [Knufia obscura]
MPSRRRYLEMEKEREKEQKEGRVGGAKVDEKMDVDVDDETVGGDGASLRGGEVARVREGSSYTAVSISARTAPIHLRRAGQMRRSIPSSETGYNPPWVFNRSTQPPSSDTTQNTRQSPTLQDHPTSSHDPQRVSVIQALDADPPTTAPTPQQIGINLADALEANAPRHQGGILDGLSDWTGYVDGLQNMSEEELKQMKEMVDVIGDTLFGRAEAHV